MTLLLWKVQFEEVEKHEDFIKRIVLYKIWKKKSYIHHNIIVKYNNNTRIISYDIKIFMAEMQNLVPLLRVLIFLEHTKQIT